MTSLLVQSFGLVAALIFCAVRIVIDLRARRFGWCAAGAIVCALLVWACVTLIPTHAIKIDLPLKS